MASQQQGGSGGGGGGSGSSKTFTTNGSGAYTDADFIGLTAGTDLHIYEYAPGGAGTLLGTSLYSFTSGTGAIGATIPLSANTKYLAFYG